MADCDFRIGLKDSSFQLLLSQILSCNVRVDLDLALLPLMKEAGCRMLMIGFEFGTQDQLERRILKANPEITVCHTTTPSIYNDIECARVAKKITGCKTILVGPHVTAEPDDTFRIAKGAVDAIARGGIRLHTPIRRRWPYL